LADHGRLRGTVRRGSVLVDLLALHRDVAGRLRLHWCVTVAPGGGEVLAGRLRRGALAFLDLPRVLDSALGRGRGRRREVAATGGQRPRLPPRKRLDLDLAP